MHMAQLRHLKANSERQFCITKPNQALDSIWSCALSEILTCVSCTFPVIQTTNHQWYCTYFLIKSGLSSTWLLLSCAKRRASSWSRRSCSSCWRYWLSSCSSFSSWAYRTKSFAFNSSNIIKSNQIKSTIFGHTWSATAARRSSSSWRCRSNSSILRFVSISTFLRRKNNVHNLLGLIIFIFNSLASKMVEFKIKHILSTILFIFSYSALLVFFLLSLQFKSLLDFT